MAISVPLLVDWGEGGGGAIKEESMKNKELRKIRDNLMKDMSSHPRYSLEGERLLYQGRFVMS